MTIALTTDELAALLACEPQTVEERARTGELPGIKFGRKWVFPAEALAHRLNVLATEEAAARRQKPAPAAVKMQKPEGRKPPKLDLLHHQPRREILAPK